MLHVSTDLLSLRIQHLLRNARLARSRARQQRPELLHEQPRILLQKWHQLQIQFFGIQLFDFLKSVMNELNQHFILHPQQLGHSFRRPLSNHRPVHSPIVHHHIQLLGKLFRLEHALLFVDESGVLTGGDAAEAADARHRENADLT